MTLFSTLTARQRGHNESVCPRRMCCPRVAWLFALLAMTVVLGFFSPGQARAAAACIDTNTVFYLNPEGANGSTTFTDQAAGSHAVSVFGNAQYSTAAAKSGTSSVYMDGSGDYLQLAHSADWGFGTSDFTIETWIKPNSGTSYAAWAWRPNTGGLGGNWINWYGTSTLGYASAGIDNSSYYALSGFTPSISDGNWHHLAMVRASGTVKLYVDGVSVGSGAFSASVMSQLSGSENAPMIGFESPYYLNGYIDDFRISKTARYTANFIPDVAACGGATFGQMACDTSTEAVMIFNQNNRAMQYCDGVSWKTMGQTAILAPTDNMAGYWKFDEGTGTSAADASGNANTGTLTNSPVWAARYTGKALQFNGTNAYVDVPNATSIDTGTGDFSVAFWYKEGVSPTPIDDLVLKGNGPFNLTGTGWQFRSRNSGTMVEFCVNGGVGTCPRVNAFKTLDSAWHHVAATVSRTGTVSKLYLDGVYKSSMAYAPTYTDTFNFNIGKGNDNYFPGSIDDVRIYKRILSDTDVLALYQGTGGTVAAGTGCTSPAADAGVMHYNPLIKSLLYCDGKDWVQMGEKSTGGTPDPSTTVPGGLIGYWKLDEASGATAADSVGTNSAPVYGAPVWQPTGGKHSGSLYFSGLWNGGNPDHLRRATGSEANPLVNRGALSLSAWIKPETLIDSQGVIIRHGTSVDQLYGLLAYNSGSGVGFRYAHHDGTTYLGVDCSCVMSLNAWHHVAAVRASDGVTIKLYLDGTLVNTVVLAGPPRPLTPANLIIGANHGAIQGFKGSIDEVRVYNRAITPAEITTLYESSGPGCTAPAGDAGEILYNTTFKVMQYCNGAEWVALGAMDSSIVAADTTPDAFNFTPDVTGAALSALRMASAITISGINASTPVSVSGGGSPQISIAGGAWGTSGNITNGQTLEVRLTSSGSANTTLTATVNVGGVTDTWSVTTVGGCAGISYGGYCYYDSGFGPSCDSTCASHGGYNQAGTAAANTQSACAAITGASTYGGLVGTNSGCEFDAISDIFWTTTSVTGSATSNHTDGSRICACNN